MAAADHLPTWINLLLKAYAFIGILGNNGLVNKFLQLFGIGPVNILFTDFAFIFVATYIEIPFMIFANFLMRLKRLIRPLFKPQKIWVPVVGKHLHTYCGHYLVQA